MIVSAQNLNTASLVVADLYVQIVPPQTYLLQGTPTNLIGIVGSAAWGPVDQPAIVGDMPSYVTTFGTPVARKYDMGTHVATAIQQGASAFRCVRVTDGTDLAAASVGVANCITFTAKYSGSLGNQLTIQLTSGSKANSFRAIIGVPGSKGEVFDNIVGTGNTFWQNFANAVNLGTGALRGASHLVIATPGAGTTAPVAAVYTFSGGTDGVAGMSAPIVVGSSSGTRTGIFALDGLGVGLILPADPDDSSQWTTTDQFANLQGSYNIVTGPSGDTITNAVTVKRTVGLDSYNTKVLFGDWILWNDQFNGLQRYVSPQGFAAGRLSNLSPEQSGLNKTIYSVVGTQRSAGSVSAYTNAELTALTLAGIDVICNPGAGGLPIFTLRTGHNSSSNAAVYGDNYTRLTNFIAHTLDVGMGLYIGRTINPQLVRQVRATLDSFLLGLLGQGILGINVDDGGLPYSVICDLGPGTNNPPERTKLGNLQADVQVQYQAINEKFIVNLEGGQTVSVVRSTSPTGQIIV